MDYETNGLRNEWIMKRYKITHQTIYRFSGLVQLLPHTLRLHPRESHELRIESSQLAISPNAELRWHRDVEGNSVVIATFADKTESLSIKNEILIQKYDLVPHDFLVAEYAVDYPFNYLKEDKALLLPYMSKTTNSESGLLWEWIGELGEIDAKIQTFDLLLRLNQHVFQTISYREREEEGVQSAERTLSCESGSCRDSANLFMIAARQLGFAARFVSGYIYSDTAAIQSGTTHAWAEVFIPGAGWKGFDPTIGNMAGVEHIAVAVARSPESVPPIAGNFFGNSNTSMTVDVQVTEVT